MKTHYAPPERLTREEVEENVRMIAAHPVIDEVMKASSGMFAVLNRYRQIVAINESFLRTMGIENAADVMGLRLGEYVKCVHACEMEGGCGTSRYCSTCGSVISTMTALDTGETIERTCNITTEKDFKELDLYFNVRSHPIILEGEKYILLFIQDISIHQQWAYLEQTFLHDISNTIQGLMGASELLKDASKVTANRLEVIRKLSQRLTQEVAIQKILSTTLAQSYQPLYNSLSVHHIFDELGKVFANHPVARDRELIFFAPDEEVTFLSDHVLVTRTLINMISNALEAIEAGDKVTVGIETNSGALIFSVWNRTFIPLHIADRIFQRNFSTKEGLGHGIGTYSMKLFGEKILGGQVSFTSTEQDGTTFCFALQSS